MDDEIESITFVELQNIKKDELVFELEEPLPANSPATSLLLNEATHSNENQNKENYLINVKVTDDLDENESEDAATLPKKCKKKKVKSVKVHLKLSNKSKGVFQKKGRTKLKEKRVRKKSVFSKPASETVVERKPKCEYPRLCVGCGHAYKTKQSFWNHKQRCPMLPENSMRNAAYDENGLPVAGTAGGEFVRRKEYICAHCERRYRKKYNLQEHLKNTCRGKPCSKGRLQCWVEGCTQAFYKYVDLVQHVTLQHGQDLQIQKLQFSNFTAFNTWKTEESNSKFMYARKITGSKRFSNTKYHYFVCQFNHRNEKKNSNRKTSRRKNDSLVVPNYNCPSRIMVKECDNVINVTYISSHNHELNLANVKYQPLEKETRAYIKTLLQLGVSAQKIKEHLQAGVGNPEIDTFLTTKQHFLTLNRIKRMESKLKAKNRARELEEAKVNGSITCDVVVADAPENSSFSTFDDSLELGVNSVQPPPAPVPARTSPVRKDSDDVVRSIQTNLKKLQGYMHKSGIKEKLSERISKMIQELCNECESVQNEKPPTARKSRASGTSRRKKTPVAAAQAAIVPAAVVVQPHPLVTELQPMQLPPHTQPITVQHIMIQPQQTMQTHQMQQQQPIEAFEQRIVNNVVTTLLNHEKSFSPVINETMDLLKPVFQPFNVNLLDLKSLDRYVSEREQMLLKNVDASFTVGYLYDAVVNSFLNLICHPLGNVIAADTNIVEYVQTNQKVPEMWHCFNWNNVDTIFIPCNPAKKHWILLVLLVKQAELQVLDPSDTYDTISNIYKKHASFINCWYNVLRTFLGIVQCNVTSPGHIKHSDPGNSGVLTCWYVFQYVNKRSLDESMDADIFRQYIFNTIVSSSSRV